MALVKSDQEQNKSCFVSNNRFVIKNLIQNK